jgi:hypothetical protein
MERVSITFWFQTRLSPRDPGWNPDTLTRRSSDMPQTDDDKRLRHQDQTVIKPQNISPGMHPLALKQNTLHQNQDIRSNPSIVWSPLLIRRTQYRQRYERPWTRMTASSWQSWLDSRSP